MNLEDEVSGEGDVYAATMYHNRGGSKPKAYEVILGLCGEPHKFEIDTSATRTVLNEETYDRSRDKVEFESSKVTLSIMRGADSC